MSEDVCVNCGELLSPHTRICAGCGDDNDDDVSDIDVDIDRDIHQLIDVNDGFVPEYYAGF